MLKETCTIIILSALGLLLVACGHPTLNPQLKSQVDAEVAAVSGGHNVTTPSEGKAKPPASGQWVRYRVIDEKGEPSLLTYKVVGAEGDAIWLEYSLVSYYYSTAYRMLVKWDLRNLKSMDIRRVVERNEDGAPVEYDSMMLTVTRPFFKRMLSLIRQEWDTNANENVSVIAGHFTGCDRLTTEFYMGTHITSEAYAHSEVPICGIVKSVSQSARLELLDYGFEGATASF